METQTKISVWFLLAVRAKCVSTRMSVIKKMCEQRTPDVSVQTMRQTAHAQFHSDARDPDADAHGHELH